MGTVPYCTRRYKKVQLGTDPFCIIFQKKKAGINPTFQNDTKGVCPQLYFFARVPGLTL